MVACIEKPHAVLVPIAGGPNRQRPRYADGCKRWDRGRHDDWGGPPKPSLGAAEGEKRAMVVYDPVVDAVRDGGQFGLLCQRRLHPRAPLSTSAEWIHGMLCETDSCTVQAKSHEEDGVDLAVVPWGATHVPA